MSVSPEQRAAALTELDRMLRGTPAAELPTAASRWLRSRFPHYAWVGIYERRGPVLELIGWDGDRPTEHVRIPLDRGLCGQAVRENRSVVVSDVRDSPAYLACFRETRSEIVVPIRRGGRAVAEIDIDGTTVGAFDASDEAFLALVGERLAGVAALFRPGSASAEAAAVSVDR